MCLLYTCTACGNDDHEHCERGYGDGKKFGGGRCICGCHGRSKSQWEEEDESRWEQLKQAIWKQFDPDKPRKSYGPMTRPIDGHFNEGDK